MLVTCFGPGLNGEYMNPMHVLTLVVFAFMLGVGQIVLKKGVLVAQQEAVTASKFALLYALMWTWQFWAAVAICGSMVLVWSWLLSIIPLSKGYPFVVLAFLFAGILEHFFFGTSLSYKFFIGCGLIVLGLVVILQQ